MVNLIFENNTYYLKVNLLELINDSDKVQPCYAYIDGATERNINRYKTHPIMRELKQDVERFCEEICSRLTDLDCVRRAYVDEISPDAGLSGYIIVCFNKPNNSEYLRKYKKDYEIKIRLSDHGEDFVGTEDYGIDMVGKNVDEFYKDVEQLVIDHNYMMQNEYQKYLQTQQVSNLQRYRKKRRIIRNNMARDRGNKRRNR